MRSKHEGLKDINNVNGNIDAQASMLSIQYADFT